VAIAMAWRGFGAWALVAQPLCGAVATLSACALAARWYPRFDFSWRKVEPLARFSAALLGTNLVGYMNRNADSLLVGRVLGAGPLGHYSMAIQLMLYPLQQVSSVFVRVLIPTLMHLRDELSRLRSAYLKAVGCIALVTFPVMGGLFAVADDFVQVAFGPAWSDMTPLVKILAWVGMFQSIGTTVGTLYLATGNPKLALRVTMIGAPVLIGGMAAGLPWGTVGVAAGYALGNLSFAYYSFVTAFRLVGLRLADLWRELAPPLGCTLAMVLVVMLGGRAVSSLDAPHRLAVCVLMGVFAYGVATLFFNRARVIELMTIVRSLRGKGDDA
jgi:PST family polysaccharide transporter